MGLYQNRIVVKVGTSTLTNEMGKSDLRSFDRLACVLSDIQNMGYEVILVSSGAIAVGTNKLNMKERPYSKVMGKGFILQPSKTAFYCVTWQTVFFCTVVSIPFFHSHSVAVVSCFKGEGIGKEQVLD